MSTNSWKELSSEQKIVVLNWAKEGLIKQTAGAVGHCAQHAMVRDMQEKAVFDPTEFYDRINPRNRSHWGHIERYVEVIDEEIRRIRWEMSSDHPAEKVTPDTLDTPDSPDTDADPAGVDQVDAGTLKEELIPPKETIPPKKTIPPKETKKKK